jgi:hypothetical protein
MVAKKADDRPATMNEIVAALEPLLAQIPAEQLQLPEGGANLNPGTGSSTDYTRGRGKLTMVDRQTRSEVNSALGLQDSHRGAILAPGFGPPRSPLAKWVPAAIALGVLGIAAGIAIFWSMIPPNEDNKSVVAAAGDAILIVETDQPNARITIDGKEIGTTGAKPPYKKEFTLPPGKVKVGVVAEGYQPIIRDAFDLTAGTRHTHDATGL